MNEERIAKNLKNTQEVLRGLVQTMDAVQEMVGSLAQTFDAAQSAFRELSALLSSGPVVQGEIVSKLPPGGEGSGG